MSGKVTIVDFGAGNLLSVARAFKHCGVDVVLAESPDDLKSAGHVVLPGVGAFADSMKGLRDRKLVDSVRDAVLSGRPFLGICVGMQMLFDESDEYGVHAGLGTIAGRVERIAGQDTNGCRLKVPHVGWALLKEPEIGRWSDTLLDGGEQQYWVYFVHSYAATLRSPQENLLAVCEYGGRDLTAAVRRDAAFGLQFHPEKSGEAGLRILRKFMSL